MVAPSGLARRRSVQIVISQRRTVVAAQKLIE
jgi:hypothetical protein